MGKDFTDKLAGGVFQQNVLNQIKSIRKNDGNSSYPNSLIANERNIKHTCETLMKGIDWNSQEKSTHIINPDCIIS